jgi:general secretion pathway protein A
LFGTLAYTVGGASHGAAGKTAAAAAASAPKTAAKAAAPTPKQASTATAAVPIEAAAASQTGTPLASPALSPAQMLSRFSTVLHDEHDAWRELAPAWKLDPGSRGDPCQAMQRQQTQCYRMTNATLAMIRQLDRPGIVSLHDGNGRPAHALLTGLTDQNATLRMGTQSLTVPLASLAAAWRGDFATLWRTPPGYANNKPVSADAGPLADWLAEQLAAVQGTRGTGLASQVAGFQLAQGLHADGIAGPTTFMQLNRVIGLSEPRLQGNTVHGTTGP